jgi:hypothetical protein
MSDLTTQEQTHVRTALKFLRLRCGTWVAVSKALRLGKSTAGNVASGEPVTPLVAFRVARLAKVTVDDVLTGRFPAPGTCPHCGQPATRPPEHT